jgi:hypothetical protein
MRQTDEILALFPGPVTLYVSQRRRLFGLVLCVGLTAFFVWLLFAEYPTTRGYRSRGYEAIMAWVAVVFWGALAIRAVFLLLFPSAASLTLDLDGFEIGYVFHRVRLTWSGVSAFHVEATYRPGRIGGPSAQIMYSDLAAGAKRRPLPEFYGRPRLRGEEFAALMNAWRARALQQSTVAKP